MAHGHECSAHDHENNNGFDARNVLLECASIAINTTFKTLSPNERPEERSEVTDELTRGYASNIYAATLTLARALTTRPDKSTDPARVGRRLAESLEAARNADPQLRADGVRRTLAYTMLTTLSPSRKLEICAFLNTLQWNDDLLRSEQVDYVATLFEPNVE